MVVVYLKITPNQSARRGKDADDTALEKISIMNSEFSYRHLSTLLQFVTSDCPRRRPHVPRRSLVRRKNLVNRFNCYHHNVVHVFVGGIPFHHCACVPARYYRKCFVCLVCCVCAILWKSLYTRTLSLSHSRSLGNVCALAHAYVHQTQIVYRTLPGHLNH